MTYRSFKYKIYFSTLYQHQRPKRHNTYKQQAFFKVTIRTTTNEFSHSDTTLLPLAKLSKFKKKLKQTSVSSLFASSFTSCCLSALLASSSVLLILHHKMTLLQSGQSSIASSTHSISSSPSTVWRKKSVRHSEQFCRQSSSKRLL